MTPAAGFAATVHCIDVNEIPRISEDYYKGELEAVDSLQPGDIMVVSRCGPCFWGELVATASRYRGARGVVIDGYLTQQTGQVTSHSLTDREVEVLKAICEGESMREIAMRLDVSVKTVETHRRRMMEKLKFFNVADLIKYAIREGITSV